jgi:hypothetical protein
VAEVAALLDQREIANILEDDVAAELCAIFSRQVAVVRPQCGPDQRRGGCGAAQEGGMAVGWRTDQADDGAADGRSGMSHGSGS